MEDNVNLSGEIFSAKNNNPDIGKLKDFGWLSNKTDREKLINENYYKSIRTRIHEGFKEEVIDFNELHALHILGRCNNPNEWNINKQGLVYGMVQSGKTANMLCLMGLANSAGYNFMILLSSEKNSLRIQTQKRVNKAFNLNPYDGTYEASENDFQEIKSLTNIDSDYKKKSSDELHSVLESNKTIIVCLKKNISILKNFVKNLKEIKDNYENDFNKIKSIIIDDEADFASIDTSNIDSDQESEFKKSTAINNEIKRIRETINDNCYVQYTATPQACIAADPDSLVGYPKDFLWLLDVYKINGQTFSYLGHNEFFDEHKSELIQIVDNKCWPHYIKDEEGKVEMIQSHWGKVDKKEQSLKDVVETTLDDFKKSDIYRKQFCYDYNIAIMDFIITCSIRWYRHYNKHSFSNPPEEEEIEKVFNDNDPNKKLEYPYHAMILNLAYEKTQLRKILTIIDLVFQSVKNDYYNDKNLFYKQFEKQKSKSNILGKTIPSLNDLKHFIDLSFIIAEKNIEDEYIYLLYSDKDGQQLEYNSRFNRTKKAAIIIGGHSLSRGLTVENLSTSFFIRSQVKSLGDTNLQMCRWFGHKRNDIDLISVYLMQFSSDLYTDLSRADNLLRDEFKESIHLNRPAECFLISLQNNHLFAATSPKKSQLLVKGYKSSYSDGKRKIINYPICKGNEKNDQKLTKFLDTLNPVKVDLSRTAKLYKNVEYKKFKSFLKDLKVPESQIYTPKSYLSYLDEYNLNGKDIPEINIALFGYGDSIIENMNDDFFFKTYVGGSNPRTKFAGDMWIDKPQDFHDKYHSGERQLKRLNGDSILICFYRFNPNWVFNVPKSKLNLTDDQKKIIKEGKNKPAIILYTIVTPLGGPTYKISHNKKRQEIIRNSHCLEWEEKNTIIYNE